MTVQHVPGCILPQLPPTTHLRGKIGGDQGDFWGNPGTIRQAATEAYARVVSHYEWSRSMGYGVLLPIRPRILLLQGFVPGMPGGVVLHLGALSGEGAQEDGRTDPWGLIKVDLPGINVYPDSSRENYPLREAMPSTAYTLSEARIYVDWLRDLLAALPQNAPAQGTPAQNAQKGDS